MKKLILILFLFPLIVLSEEYILVKQIWGKVNLIQSEKNVSDLRVYSVINPTDQIELLNKESKVWIRDNNHNDIIIEFDKENNYSYYDIKSLIVVNSNTQNKEKSFVNQFLSLMSVPKKDSESQVNGMLLSSKTGVSRNFNDTNLIFLEDILILEGMPFKVDFTSLIENDNAFTYSIIINDKWSKKRLFEFKTKDPWFEIENKIEGSLGINWELKISNFDNKKSFLCNISSIYLDSESLQLLNILEIKAKNEIGSDENLFQSILLEILLSKELYSNVAYYKHLFNQK